jgi:hypothetical protein
MFTLQALADTYGLSYKQVRDRLTALGPLIDPHIVEGKNNAKLLKDSGRAIFDRLIQLEREGLTIGAAKAVIEQELASDGGPEAGDRSSNGGQADAVLRQMQARLDEQGQQIAFLQDQVRRLMDQLAEAQAQIQAMLPASVERSRRRWWQFWR